MFNGQVRSFDQDRLVRCVYSLDEERSVDNGLQFLSSAFCLPCLPKGRHGRLSESIGCLAGGVCHNFTYCVLGRSSASSPLWTVRIKVHVFTWILTPMATICRPIRVQVLNHPVVAKGQVRMAQVRLTYAVGSCTRTSTRRYTDSSRVGDLKYTHLRW